MASSKGVQRYSLMVKDIKNNKEYLIKFKEKDEVSGEFIYKDKAFLTTIDNRTTDFKNKNQLLSYLKYKGYINFDYGDIYITYKHAKKNQPDDENKTANNTRTLEVVYKEHSYLKTFASKYQSEINMRETDFIRMYNQFLSDIKQGRFYRFMLKEGYINDYLKGELEKYIYSGKKEVVDLALKNIAKQLSRYKVMRGYILARDKFDILYSNKYNASPALQQEKLIKEQMQVKINSPETEDCETEKPIVVEVDSNDEFLNYLDDYDEISNHYTLDDLERIDIIEVNDSKNGNQNQSIFDGLPSPKVKIKK